MKNLPGSANKNSRPLRLSAKRAAVAELACLGLPDKAIALKENISEETVAWHLRQLYRHYDVHSRAAMVRCHLGNGSA